MLQSEFGGPPKPGEGSTQVVGQVIERLAQDADMRRVLVEERIELTDKDGQLAAAMGRTDSRGEVAGLKDPAGCFGDFAQRTRCAPRQQRAGGYGEKKHEGANDSKGAPQRRKQDRPAGPNASKLNHAPWRN